MRHVAAFMTALGAYTLSWVFVPERGWRAYLFMFGVLTLTAGIGAQYFAFSASPKDPQ